MSGFEFKRSSRKCSVTGRAFEPGENYHSVLIENSDELVRQDIGEDSWDGPPENCLAWWKSRIPDLEKGRVYWAPRDVLFSCFEHLLERRDHPEQTYVLAILLVQKKYLRLLDTEMTDGHEVMLLANSTTREKYQVDVVDLNETQIREIEDMFAEKLFTDIAPENSEAGSD